MFDFWSLAIPSIVATVLSITINQLVEHVKSKRQGIKRLVVIKALLCESIQKELRLVSSFLNRDSAITLRELQNTLNDAEWQKLKDDMYSLNKKLSKIVADYYTEQENMLRQFKDAGFGVDYAAMAEPCLTAGKKVLSVMGISNFVP